MGVGAQSHSPAALTTERVPVPIWEGRVGHNACLEGIWRKPLAPLRFQTRSVEDVARRYTDYATQAQTTVYTFAKTCVENYSILFRLDVAATQAELLVF